VGGKHRKKRTDHSPTAVVTAAALAVTGWMFTPKAAEDTQTNLKPIGDATQPDLKPIHICTEKYCEPIPDGNVTVPIEPMPTPTTVPPPPPKAPAPPPPPPPPPFVPGQNGTGWQAMWGVIKKHFPDAKLVSGVRNHTCGQYHCRGLAIDIVASASRMREIDRWIYETYGRRVSQLIHTPGPYNILNGVPFNYDAGTDADHYDHVHWAQEGPV